MRHLIAIIALLILTAPAHAIPTVACHCFQDRSFDPQRPAAVDPYLLANARNSLFAAVFRVEKGAVVQAVMTGSQPEELWVSHYLAERTKNSVAVVETLRRDNNSWGEILKRLQVQSSSLGEDFYRAAQQGAGSDLLASLAVNAILLSRLGCDPQEISRLRSAGAGDRELILALFLSRKTGRPAKTLFDEVRGGGSWGKIFAATGLNPKEIEREMRALVSAYPTR